LNAGILLRAIFEPLYEWTGLGVFDVLARVSPFLLLAAAIGFVVSMWGRVRELKRR
jgi:hypothetical protein